MSNDDKQSSFLKSVLSGSQLDKAQPNQNDQNSVNHAQPEKTQTNDNSNAGDKKLGIKKLASTVASQTQQTLNQKPAPLSLAVVGHTNTGKTSLLRTLLRDAQFGEVKNQAATTKHVERTTIFEARLDAGFTDLLTEKSIKNPAPLIDLYDTPGLEDAGGLLDWLDEHTNPRADGVERLHTFLADKVADDEFNQEAKVLRQLLTSDVALYVIDTREPVLSKYKDELQVLSWCAKPVMPIFNFIHQISDTQLTDWQTMLAKKNLHVSTRFDTVAFDFEGEMQLWQNLDTLLSNSTVSQPILSDTIQHLMSLRTNEWEQLEEQARIEIAHMLLNVAAYKREIKEDDDPTPVLAEMQEKVRQLERQLHNKLLSLYRFYDSDVAPTQLALEAFQRDPFNPELLKEYGIRTSSGAAAGALVGLGIDAATFGASLGLGAAIGGLVGGVLSNTQSIADKIMGKQSLFIDPATLTLLATRALDLLTALMHRGHGDQSVIRVHEQKAPWSEKLPSELKKARGHHAWSELNTQKSAQSRTLRDEDAWRLSRDLLR